MTIGSYLIKEDNRIYFQTRYNADFIKEVKEIPGRKYNPDLKQWDVPNNFASVEQVNSLIKKYELVNLSLNQENTESYINPLLDIENSIQRLKTAYISKIEAKFNNPIYNQDIKLRDYQIEGLIYNLLTKRCFDASEPGTGKTFTTIFTLELEDLFPCLIVVPASIKYNWEMQWNKINPERSISIIENKNGNFDADVLIMSYDSSGKKEIVIEKEIEKEKINIKFEQLSKIQFKCIVCDESQMVKSSKTVRSKSLKKLIKKVEYRYLLTGTPVMNRPSEIINQLEVLNQFKDTFGNWMDFVEKYCGAVQTKYGLDYSGATNVLELNERMRKSCYHRVEKREVLLQLPDREETLLEVDLDNYKEYDKAENDLITYLKENKGQLYADNAMSAKVLVTISTLSMLSAKGKVSSICEWIDNFLESSNEKLVVFGIHKDIIKELAKKYKCDFITGEVPAKKRQEIVNEFQVNQKRVLFMNILTGGVGIDGLQNVCSTVLVIEFPWRWEDIEQAVSRIERDGQKNNSNIYFMMARGSIDVMIWFDVLMEKRKITSAVNSGQDVDTNQYLNKVMNKLLQ